MKFAGKQSSQEPDSTADWLLWKRETTGDDDDIMWLGDVCPLCLVSPTVAGRRAARRAGKLLVLAYDAGLAGDWKAESKLMSEQYDVYLIQEQFKLHSVRPSISEWADPNAFNRPSGYRANKPVSTPGAHDVRM